MLAATPERPTKPSAAAARGVLQLVAQIVPGICGTGAKPTAAPGDLVARLFPGLGREKEGRASANQDAEDGTGGEDRDVLPVRLDLALR